MNVFDENGTYSRCCSVSRDKLENKIKSLYKSQWCEIASSGMNAISMTLYSIFSNDDKHIVYVSDQIFGFSKSQILKLSQTFNKSVVYFDVEDPKEITAGLLFLKDKISCVYMESCSNPKCKMMNAENIQYISKHAKLIVDNTWLSPVLYNPFKYGSYIVVDSCTKYLSGGMCIAGCINFKYYDNITKLIARNISLFGIHVTKDTCDTVYNRLESLETRVNNASVRAYELYMALINNVIVYYNTKYKPAVMQIAIKCNNTNDLENIVEQHDFKYETSFGKSYDSIDSYPKYYDNHLHLRINVGYDDNSLIPKIEKLINYLKEL